MDADPSLSGDIKELLDTFTAWKNKYIKKCNDVKEMECVIKAMKEELKIATNRESSVRYQLSRFLANLNQTQEIVNQLLPLKDEALRVQEEKKLLEGQLLEKTTAIELECETWAKTKAQLIVNHEEQVNNLKKLNSDEVMKMSKQYKKEKQELESTIEKLKKNIEDNRKESDQVLRRTIGNYEEKLMKMNEDLAAAQTDIKNLRQRWAINKCPCTQKVVQTAQRTAAGGSVDGDLAPPVEVSAVKDSRPQKTLRSPSYLPYDYPQEHYSEPKLRATKTDKPGHENNETASVQVRKATFPTARKRKLFSRSDDMFYN